MNLCPKLRQAAIVVATLDRSEADAVLRQLPAAEARRVRQAVVALGEIDDVERAEVFEAFCRSCAARENSLVASASSRSAAAGSPSHLGKQSATMFADVDAAWLTAEMKHEHPQTVAVVLSHLDREQAAQVIAGLTPDMKTDVVRRLSELDEMDPESLREIDQGLTARFARTGRRPRGSANAASEIMQAAAKVNNDASRPVAPAPLNFVDVLNLDHQSVTAIGREAEPELIVLALTGAERAAVDRFLARLAVADADEVRHGLGQARPTRLSDVEAAQRELGVIAARQLSTPHMNAA